MSHKISDFFSFYYLPSTIINHPKHNILEVAYLFYYATDVAFETGAEQDGRLKNRIQELISHALVYAEKAKFDVFNAMTLMDNVPILADLKVAFTCHFQQPAHSRFIQFGAGDGLLNFYLYNYRTAPLAGVQEIAGVPPGKGVGVVMV